MRLADPDLVRLALGATFVLSGLAMGIVCALALTRVMGSLLYGVSSHDPVTFACVVLLLMLVALAASYLPARNGMRVDLAIALRQD